MAAVLALGACIQGPWDFYPDNPPTFHGVYLYAYAIADRPLENFCFEPMLDLDQASTEAFAFYDSADVKVTGSFAGEVKTMTLTPVDSTPNCFQGEAAALIERGQAYDLDAHITWDSAGRTVTSRLTGTAKVPASFSVRDSAVAPGLAEHGMVPENIFDSTFLRSLSPDIQLTLIEEFRADTLVPLLSDSVALGLWVKEHGAAFQGRLMELLEKQRFVYAEGDTIFYLNGALNTLSHYFTADRSADVNSVLITQRFEPDSKRPETRFDNILGLKPDSSTYYFPGNTRRLITYPDAKGSKGWNLLDSMGFVNTWFHTGRNTIIFYGFEQAYTQYLNSTTGGGGQDPDARVKPKFNITGGQGIFVGSVPDTFFVNIEIDTLTKSYYLPEVHGAYCRDEGWLSNKDCRAYYRPYCSSKDWNSPGCGQDAIEACLEADLDHNDSLKAGCSHVADSVSVDPTLAERALTRFCVEKEFPEANADCADQKTQCLETKGLNSCKQALWDYCLDHNWKSATNDNCLLGLVSYCREKSRPSEILCRNADAYCREHPGENLCK